MAVIRVPWLRLVVCVLLAAAPSAVVALDPVSMSASAPGAVAAASDAVVWVLKTPVTSPPAREGHAMAYDSARGRVVLFGGTDGNGPLGDTWEWDGHSWVQRTPATSPTARYGHAMAYDSARGHVVLFGGGGSPGESLADTWDWDGSSWVQRTPATSPPARTGQGMTYDSFLGRLVLFGGQGPAPNYAGRRDTWEWIGTTWLERTPYGRVNPLPRRSTAMVYESLEGGGRVLLFGGYNLWPGASDYLDDTWIWDGLWRNWYQVSLDTSPRARESHAMAYDSARACTVLFGGFSGGLIPWADTWEWLGSGWVQRTPATHPPARAGHAMAYDSARKQVVLFGGAFGGAVLDDTWEYGPANPLPVADAGPDQVLECTGDGKATAALDGSASTDPDSTPGTNDDIVTFDWTENGAALASGETASVPFQLGVHEVLLTVTDRAGATGTDGTIVTVQDTTPPAITCPSSVRVECQAAGESPIALPPAIAADGCFGEVPITNDRTPGGADASGSYPLGSTTVTFTARDGAGNSATCQTVVTVVDTTPPVVTVETTPHYLWPPNHTMSPVHSRVVVHDACDPSPQVILASVVSSEPDDAPGGGDGNTTNDIQGATLGTPDFDVLIRAERDGNGPGRTYTIRYQALDASGNIGAGQDVVIVPHDQGGIGQDPITRQQRSAKPGTRGGQSSVVEVREDQ